MRRLFYFVMVMLHKGGGGRTDLKRVKGREPKLLCYSSVIQISGYYF